MNNLFLKRPILAIVFSIVVVMAGLVSLKILPLELFPSLFPPVVNVSAVYPGASADTIALTVATPIEKAVMNIKDVLYTSSINSTPGNMRLSVYFRSGADPNLALSNVQNQVNSIFQSLPQEVKKTGLNIDQASNDILFIVAIVDQAGQYDQMFLSNFATVHVADEIQRIPGVSLAYVENAGDYSMRIWLKPDRLAQFKLSPSDVTTAIAQQNALYSIGQLGQEPNLPNTRLTIPVTTSGLLTDVKEFENIIIRVESDGSMIQLKDVSRIELGSQDYQTMGTLNGKNGIFISVHQAAGSNQLEIAQKIKDRMSQLSPLFPPGIGYSFPYDPTKYVKQSVDKVVQTLFEAAFLVSLFICLFLHSFRAALIPLIAMVVSIVGTFFGLYLLGYSLNALTLFGLILSIGIVVDDAIVVVESVEYHIKVLGMSSVDAVRKTMKEVTSSIIAIVFALTAVFIPIAFMSGLVGQLYKQFAVTIVISIVLSGFAALTLSPVLSMILLKKMKSSTRLAEKFNQVLNRMMDGYIRTVNWLLHNKVVGIGLWLAFLCSIGILFRLLPMGLVPMEDQGAIIIVANLPDGASLGRTREVSQKVETILMETPGVQDVVGFSGIGGLAKRGIYYVGLKDWSERKSPDLHVSKIQASINAKLSQIPEAKIFAFNPSPIPGVGSGDSSYNFWLINHSSSSYEGLEKVVQKIVDEAKTKKEFSFVDTTISTDSLGLFLDIDKLKAMAYGVKLEEMYYSLQIMLGSVYVNDFNKFGRMFRVIAQAEPADRQSIEDIENIYVRSNSKTMIPLKSFVTAKFSKGHLSVEHYNGSPATQINVNPAASPDQVIAALEEITIKNMLPGMSFAWSGTAYQAIEARGSVVFALVAGLALLFFILAALYERWSLPFISFLVLPFAALGALLAIWLRGLEIDLYFQIGLIASIGISAKNAILIVEFARQKREEGLGIIEATLEAARRRFRAILMTSLTLIFAMVPLAISFGAGAASKQSLATGVIGGVFVATLLGLFFVPFFFALLEREEKKE